MRSLADRYEKPLERVSGIIDESLEQLPRVGTSPTGPLWESAWSAVRDIARAPSRMVRPRLVLLGFEGAGGDTDLAEVHAFAAGVELLHLFALVHDDVMDHGTTRRGRPTVHKVVRESCRGEWSRSEHLAFLVGDTLHACAVDLLLRPAAELPGTRAAVSVLMRASVRAGLGQFLDLEGWSGPAAGLEPADFRRILVDKGGHHSITAPLVAGWRLASEEVPAGLEAWGDHVGLAFQGLDDLQDVLAPSGTTGKDALQDLREGRLSLLSYLLRRQVGSAEWGELAADLGHGLLDVPTRQRLFRLLEEHRLPEQGLAVVRQELEAARERASALAAPASFRADLHAVTDEIAAFADQLERAAD